MSQIKATRTINAPLESVFATVADINNYSKAIPGIVKAEIISEVQSGVGTRFRETRVMKGREATEEMEVTEYVENDHIRIVCDSHGTVWDSVFRVARVDDGTELTLTMDANAHKFMAKIMNPIVSGAIGKALEGDMDAVKTYCENQSRPV